MTTYSYPLYAGGASAAVWCWLIAGIGAMCLALSISEVASAYPTSGAMYFTIKYLAPEKYVPIIAWVDGMSKKRKKKPLSVSRMDSSIDLQARKSTHLLTKMFFTQAGSI